MMPGRLRLVTLALLLAAPAAAAEPPASAEDAYDAYRRMTTAVKPACPTATEPDEIVVCGEVDSSQHRLPREESGPVIAGAGDARGEREGLAGGGACGGRFAHGRPGCAGGINVLAIGGAIARAIGKVAGPDQ